MSAAVTLCRPCAGQKLAPPGHRQRRLRPALVVTPQRTTRHGQQVTTGRRPLTDASASDPTSVLMLSHYGERDGVNDQCGAVQQDFGVKAQDQAGSVALTTSLVLSANAWHGGVVDSATPAAPLLLGRIGRALSARPLGSVTVRSRIIRADDAQKGQNGNSNPVFGARLLRRPHGRTVTDGLFQNKVTARRSAAVCPPLTNAIPHLSVAA
jgi:hypothetical protein